jgi:hypothetical protein
MSYEEGMLAINHAIMRGYNALQPGAYEVILVGEIKGSSGFHSMMADLVRPTNLHQTFVKLQYNCTSNRGIVRMAPDRAMTGHEMIAVFKKPSGYEMAIVVPKAYRLDIRDSKQATWKDVVFAVMRKVGKADLNTIYKEIEGHKKCATCPTWKATVRQVLQFGPYKNVERGVWAIAA